MITNDLSQVQQFFYNFILHTVKPEFNRIWQKPVFLKYEFVIILCYHNPKQCLSKGNSSFDQFDRFLILGYGFNVR